jgi:AbrB family looped-hinge helix DNA binding protein
LFYHFTMNVTIDKLGRVVVPKTIRDRYHLVPGTALEMEVAEGVIRMVPVNSEPALVRKEGVLIHHGTGTSDLDIAAFINRNRANRNADIAAEEPVE